MKKNTFITGICTAAICLWGATACTNTSEQDLWLKNATSTKAVEYYTVEISLSTAGTLAQELGERANEVEKLVLSGPINADDVLTIQSLRGTLEAIDMRDVTIVESNVIDENGDITYEVQNNTIPYGMFSDMLLSEIVLPENITEIGPRAFQGINGYYPLHITIPESVTTIGGTLFSNCANLTSVQFSSNLQEIPDYTFHECERLESVTNINSVRYIGRAFAFCKSLKQIELPECLQEIGNGCFEFSGLTSITLPDSVKLDIYMGSGAFTECTSLQSIVLPQQTTTIPSFFLADCTALQQVDIPNTVTTIGESAFYGCTSLENIRIPENVTSIGVDAFYNCSSFTSIEIPDGITEIPKGMLNGCTSLHSVSLPESVRRLGDYAFGDCNSLKTIELPSDLREIGASCFWSSGLTSIDLSGKIATLGYECFTECDSLKSLTIPANITTVGVDLIHGSLNLTSIIWEADINVPELYSYEDACNSNCLLYVNSENVEVESTFIKNIIRNGVAENIELTYGGHYNRGFNAPQAFKAKNISVTKLFHRETIPGTANGWETIALPFTPTLITAEDGRVLAPFNSEVADAKPFWLRRMTNEGFVNTPQLESGVPYIIAMPNNSAYLPEYNISGEVTFSAQSEAGIDIPVTETQITCDQGPEFSLTSFFDYMLWENYSGELPNIYLLENDCFLHIENSPTSVFAPFQCYATRNSGSGHPAFFAIDGSKAATRTARPLGPVPSIDDM